MAFYKFVHMHMLLRQAKRIGHKRCQSRAVSGIR